MNFDPQKFFIGMMDFFTILLPGALLTYLFKDDVGPLLLGDGYGSLQGSEGWTVFLFSSYLFGHFIFLLGSRLLDDYVYDPIRNSTPLQQIKKLAEGKRLSPRWQRRLAADIFKEKADHALNQVLRIKEAYLDLLHASHSINAFQWSKAILAIEHPEALATVQRFEADSKFFRSLMIVLLFIIPWGVMKQRYELAVISVSLLILSFLRYMDQRAKSILQTYWYIITLEIKKGTTFQHTTAKGLSHAGGVVFKVQGDEVEYLLVTAKKTPHEWVLPKGHIKPGELSQETAVREVLEESGVWASIRSELPDATFMVNGEPIRAQFYLMEFEEQEEPKEKREYKWLHPKEAIEQAIHSESKELLKQAGQARVCLSEEKTLTNIASTEKGKGP